MSLIMHRQHGIGADTKDLAKALKRLHMALTGPREIPALHTQKLKESIWRVEYIGEDLEMFRSRMLRDHRWSDPNEEDTTMCLFGPGPDFTAITETDTCECLLTSFWIDKDKSNYYVGFVGNDAKFTFRDPSGQYHDICVDSKHESYATLVYKIRVKLGLHDHVDISIFFEDYTKLSSCVQGVSQFIPLCKLSSSENILVKLNKCIVRVYDKKEALTNENIHKAVESYYSRHVTGGIQWEVRKIYGHIRDWIVGSVTDMHDLFNGRSLMQDDISAWNVSSLKNASHMFQGADSFNADISGWDTRSLEDASHMFQGAECFNQSLEFWDVSSLVVQDHMFDNTDSLEKKPSWYVEG